LVCWQRMAWWGKVTKILLTRNIKLRRRSLGSKKARIIQGRFMLPFAAHEDFYCRYSCLHRRSWSRRMNKLTNMAIWLVGLWGTGELKVGDPIIRLPLVL
jgi:hypothetical protein